MTIGSLPDNVLLNTFHLYQTIGSLPTDEDVLLERFLDKKIKYHLKWRRLVHVCRRWRYIVFASPRHLGLQFRCRATTPVGEILAVWPPMQIIIDDPQPTHLDGINIIAALEHPDLVCLIDLSKSPLTSSLLERLTTVMQKPFPVLKRLHLYYDDQNPPVLPSTFLGGSAPRLESLQLRGIPFPALPRLLLSARNLVKLELYGVPYTGYISPKRWSRACPR